jgi:hypothetical protein
LYFEVSGKKASKVEYLEGTLKTRQQQTDERGGCMMENSITVIPHRMFFRVKKWRTRWAGHAAL